jgi:hypothetical protein
LKIRYKNPRIQKKLFPPSVSWAIGSSRGDALRKWESQNPVLKGTLGKEIYKFYRTVLPSTTTPDCPGTMPEIGAKRVCVYEMKDVQIDL